MVVLQRRFTLLAALTTLAAVSVLPPSVEGAVVPADYKEVDSSTSTVDAHHSTHSHTLTHTDSAAHTRPTGTGDDDDDKAQRQQQPILPLPPSMSGSSSSKTSGAKHEKDGGSDEDRQDSASDKREVRDQFGHASYDGTYLDLDMDVMHVPYSKRHDHDRDRHHDEVVVNGDHDDVHMHRRTVNSRFRARAPDGVAHVGGGALPHLLPDEGFGRRSTSDEVVVNGHDDHIRGRRLVHGRRSPRHHDHDHDRHRHGKVVINGSNDKVHVPRSPHDHDHDRHRDHGEVIVNGDNDHVDDHYRRAVLDPSIYVSDNNGSPYMMAHAERDGQQISGVPGSIDIMSDDPSSPNALKIASLVLSTPSNGTTTGNSTASSFVLNASGSDHTQMYLVAAQNAINSTSSNSSASAGNTTSTGPSLIQVALQIPVFNAETAQMDPYCATFDPNPPAPSPLTVEQCMANNTAGGEHKSQLFAFEPATGVIRPMWSSNSTDPSLDSDGSVIGPDNSTATSTSASGTSSATSSPSSASMATDSMTSMAPTSTNLAQDIVKGLEGDWTEATKPPLRAASAQAFDAASQARNVTLVFTPAAPMVAPAAGAGPIKAVVPSSSADDSGDDAGDGSGADGSIGDDGNDSGDDNDDDGNDSGDDSDDDGNDSDDDGDGSDGSIGASGSLSVSFASSTMASGSSSAPSTASTASSTSAAGMSDSASSTATSSMGVFSDPAAKIASESASTAPASSATNSTSTTTSDPGTDTATSTLIETMPTATDSASMTIATDSTSTMTTDVTSTTVISDSDTTTSTTASGQNPSLAVEVYDPNATPTLSGSQSTSVSGTDSSLSETESSSSVAPTSSASLVARQMTIANSSAMTTSTASANATSTLGMMNSTSTSSTSAVKVTGFAGKFREGTVLPQTA